MELPLHLIVCFEGEGAMPALWVFGMLAVDGGSIMHVRSNTRSD